MHQYATPSTVIVLVAALSLIQLTSAAVKMESLQVCWEATSAKNVVGIDLHRFVFMSKGTWEHGKFIPGTNLHARS